MPSPFPGMDPYLEHPDYWSECHNRLIVAIADHLVPCLRPRYEVAIEKRIYNIDAPQESLLVGIPDVVVQQKAPTGPQTPSPLASSVANRPLHEPITVTVPLPTQIKQSYLEVRELATGQVITAIEVLSPVNKRTGRGRNDYLKKRSALLNSTTHLIEVDLLRAFTTMPLDSGDIESPYRILVSRSDRRPQASLYAFKLQDALPELPLPLQPQDTEPMISFPTLLTQVYDRAGFDYRVDYTQDPLPPLSNPDQSWMVELLQARGIRSSSGDSGATTA